MNEENETLGQDGEDPMCYDPTCWILFPHESDYCHEVKQAYDGKQSYDECKPLRAAARSLAEENENMDKAKELFSEGMRRLNKDSEKIWKCIERMNTYKNMQICGSPVKGKYPNYDFLFSSEENFFIHGRCSLEKEKCTVHIGWEENILTSLNRIHSMIVRTRSSLQLRGPIILPFKNTSSADTDEEREENEEVEYESDQEIPIETIACSIE